MNGRSDTTVNFIICCKKRMAVWVQLLNFVFYCKKKKKMNGLLGTRIGF